MLPDTNPEMETSWLCPTCGINVSTRYCGKCGEQRLGKHDLSLVALGAQAIESLTNVDGRVFRSFKMLVLRPGELTAAYIRGQRKLYVGPFQLFIIVNVLFFFLQSLFGFQSLSNDLDSHLGDQVYSTWVSDIAEERFAATGTSRDAYTPIFDNAVSVNARALALLLVPMFALVVLLVSMRRGRPVITHMVFTLHFVAFLLSLMCLLPLLAIPIIIVLKFAGSSESLLDPIVTWIYMGIILTYTYQALGRVYGGTALWRVLKAVILAGMLVPMFRLYRLIVFFITLYST